MNRKIIIYILFNLLICLRLFSSVDGNRPIQRMGNANVQLFDEDWLFMRYGLQADGMSLPEPSGLEKAVIDESGWQKLD